MSWASRDPSRVDAPAGDQRAARRRNVKRSHLVAAAIVREIVERGLDAGDQLPMEAALATEFGVGRASIREALRLLEGLGVLKLRRGQRGGPVVSAVRPTDVGQKLSFFLHVSGATYGDLVQARAELEPLMVRLAARRRDPRQLHALGEILEAEARASQDAERSRLSDEFHYAVSGMSGNLVLDLLGRGLRTLHQNRTSTGEFSDAALPPHDRLEHRAIGEAIVCGEEERAGELMRQHMKRLAAVQLAIVPALGDERVTWHGQGTRGALAP